MPLFPFAQFEVPGRLGLPDGRYLARDISGEADDVIVISSLQALRRERRRRSRRVRDAGVAPETQELPVTRVTVVRATAFDDEGEAKTWLDGMRCDTEARDHFTADARILVNRSLHAHRAATMDPYIAELGPHSPAVTRLGFGEGEALAGGEWSAAIDAPPDPGPRRRRIDALRPQERVAGVLGRRDRVDVCETLVLRARLDLDHGRTREAALQLGPGLRALLAEVEPGNNEEQSADLTEARARLAQVDHVAKEALTGELPDQLAAVVGDTLALCERILRRRRILGTSG